MIKPSDRVFTPLIGGRDLLLDANLAFCCRVVSSKKLTDPCSLGDPLKADLVCMNPLFPPCPGSPSPMYTPSSRTYIAEMLGLNMFMLYMDPSYCDAAAARPPRPFSDCLSFKLK